MPRKWAMFYTAQLILHLTKLGFTINWKRISPPPHQQVEYLRFVLNTCRLRVALSDQWQTAAGSLYPRQAATEMALTVMQALGFIAAAHPVVPLGVCLPSLGCQETQAMLGYHSPLITGRPAILGVPKTPFAGNTSGTNGLLHTAPSWSQIGSYRK